MVQSHKTNRETLLFYAGEIGAMSARADRFALILEVMGKTYDADVLREVANLLDEVSDHLLEERA